MNTYQVNLKNEVAIDKVLRGQAELVQRLASLEVRLAAALPRT